MMLLAAFMAFVAAAALAAGVTDNIVTRGSQPHLDVGVFFFVILLSVGLCCLAEHARGRR